ncbi:MAG TPA: serine/threonine-protein kinase, partial [Gemmatimonadaceae bacterium]
MSAGDSLHDALRRVTAGRYWIERELARGGMGAVFLARDIALERVVAIKVLLPDVATPQVRERFLREARTAAGLSHPHIVAVHAVEAHDALAFFVMAHIDGETLRERVTRAGPLSPAEAIRLMQEVAWALGHAHERGIVHRDVKPDNLILERSTGRALVTDFGIAALVDGDVLARSGEILGTPHFISPEQARGETVDGRSDLYSLGATMYFALSGRPPFEAPGAAGLLAKHVAEPAPSIGTVRDDLPPHLVALVDACLAKDPRERPASGEWLARELEAARQVAPAVAPALVRIADETDRLAYEGTGYAGLAAVGLWVAGADGIFGMFEAIAGWTAVMVSTGLAGARAIQFGADVRRLTRAGFAESEIRRAIAQPRR